MDELNEELFAYMVWRALEMVTWGLDPIEPRYQTEELDWDIIRWHVEAHAKHDRAFYERKSPG